jgi:cytidine deaminase
MSSNEMDDHEQHLIETAKAVRLKAHAPYSGFRVGAAITDENGATHAGCNVENAAYPEGICAEANAIGAMISGGGSKIAGIAVVGGKDNIEACTPCGGCRQKIREFADAETRIVLLGEEEKIDRYSIDDLLPAAFQLNR